MRKEHRPSTAAPTAAPLNGYVLPEDAHLALVQTRDQLRLLARLTEPGHAADDGELSLSPLALAHCFDRLASELDGIVDAAQWPRGME
ncbi:hypothetical protein J2X06_000455 [Lysobacter niastensis]|uniref:XAC0095-like domain-containing protein n=1 Tax=Lysobacter niastensis TaxID=380629 RepID=A0ABU1W6Q7_9GAMM|nr:hypothetical protein [Lysobacter niastensis]MDR7133271.1 hypothetical protein [Lysobacter niastensis]